MALVNRHVRFRYLPPNLVLCDSLGIGSFTLGDGDGKGTLVGIHLSNVANGVVCPS